MRGFFGSHEKRFASGIVPAACLLLDLFTALQNAGLTPNLVNESAADTADRVQILEFDFCSKLPFVFSPKGNVAITTEVSLLHVSIAHGAVHQNLFQCG